MDSEAVIVIFRLPLGFSVGLNFPDCLISFSETAYVLHTVMLISGNE